MEEKFDVVVVGGGLAGLSLAFGLADRGHPVAVLEARIGVKPVKRGMTLSPNGLEVLDKLHLLEEVERIGRKVRLVKFLKSSGEMLAAYDYSLLRHKQNYLLTFLPHELEILLRTRVQDRHVKLYEGASFDGLLRENGRVKGVRATIAKSVHNLQADVIVGADGAMSKVRESAGIEARAKKYPSSYVVTVADDVDKSPDEARHYLAKGKMLGIFPLPGGSYLFYYLPAGTFEGLKANGLEPFKTKLTTLAPELEGPLKTINSWEDFSYMVPQGIRTDSWVSDHVALIGDAAHSLEPSLGQGGSLALKDVVVLLEVLDNCFAKSDFSAKELKSYEDGRRSQTEFMQSMAERTAMYMNTGSRLIGWLRDRSLRNAQENRMLMLLVLEMASGMIEKLGAVEKLRLAGIV